MQRGIFKSLVVSFKEISTQKCFNYLLIVIISCLGAKLSVSLSWCKIVCLLSACQIVRCQDILVPNCPITIKAELVHHFFEHVISYHPNIICWFYNSLYAIYNIGLRFDRRSAIEQLNRPNHPKT